MSAPMTAPCRFVTKRRFESSDAALAGAETIRGAVQARGDRYEQLHPYLCPDAAHWHLSHYPQGTAVCPCCGEEVSAFDVGAGWVVSPHGGQDTACLGAGMQVERIVAS
ncbi:uncharacterized protein RMCC_1803 [Mycolicibacterium canariasense]|uniref:Uncharacterized protein n=2 Tax=Mycolicibacterium TaxID=1866885 RepID=A0A100WAC5_MYCCR|nr:hypothetical protein [Mycolicibacterium canariasense]MCV7211499.1 hypothetical protein [Mycolicibacterium canariasense]GAS94837.1 uncharacterized protein RMCC_1803 [Mycolicibacterium canariasense]